MRKSNGNEKQRKGKTKGRKVKGWKIKGKSKQREGNATCMKREWEEKQKEGNAK